MTWFKWKKKRKFFSTFLLTWIMYCKIFETQFQILTNSQSMDGSVFTKMLVLFDNEISKIKVLPQFQTVLLFKTCLWQFGTFWVSETCLWQEGLYHGIYRPLSETASLESRSTSVLPINHVIQMPQCLLGFVNHDYWCNGQPLMSKDPCRPHAGDTQWSMWVCLFNHCNHCLSSYNFHDMSYKKC